MCVAHSPLAVTQEMKRRGFGSSPYSIIPVDCVPRVGPLPNFAGNEFRAGAELLVEIFAKDKPA